MKIYRYSYKENTYSRSLAMSGDGFFFGGGCSKIVFRTVLQYVNSFKVLELK